MFMSYESTNACHFNRIRLKIVILAWTLMICFGGQTLAMTQNNDAGQTAKSEAPLLLNSGIAQAQYAEVSVILWFEDRDIPVAIRTSKPTPEWIWTYKELQMENEVIATLTGQQTLNKSEENSLYAWYTTIVPQIEKAGGEIYLDERINQAVDISAYLSQTNADPAQWVLIDNMISTAAYQKNIETSVIAGQDQINIQLLSRGKGNVGQSVLAIPALLKEF